VYILFILVEKRKTQRMVSHFKLIFNKIVYYRYAEISELFDFYGTCSQVTDDFVSFVKMSACVNDCTTTLATDDISSCICQ